MAGITGIEAGVPLDGFERQTATAAQALEALSDRAASAAGDIEVAFDRAGDSLVRSLARAAADGKVSLDELARALLGAVNAAAGQGGGLGGGLGAAISQALSGLFGGTRADGGAVAPGQAYLVGERGPEVFRPSTSGVIDAGSAASITVNLSMERDAAGLLRSEAQIAQMLARAVRLGAGR